MADDTLEQNKAIVRRMLEAFNTGNTAIVAELLDQNIKDQGRHIGFESALRSEHPIRRVATEILREQDAFADRVFKEESLVAEGDTVILHWSMTGTNTGPILGNSPTGKQVQIRGTEIVRIQNGKIIEHRGDDGGNLLDALRQLGLLNVTLLNQLETGSPQLGAGHRTAL